MLSIRVENAYDHFLRFETKNEPEEKKRKHEKTGREYF